MQYRSEIDGLRAIAVLWVFLFHLDFSFIPGGFVGVDIFYVISGFVIFRSLINDFNNDRLSIGGFYKRRIRRILPAVIVTVLISLCAGLWLLTPRELVAFAESAIASLISVSNFYFSSELSYFADAAHTIPLLHTWSLGVEEQFYLIAPILMLALAKKWGKTGIVWGLSILTVASFLYGLFALYGLEDENHAFYLPMGRFWEIGIGALLACVEPFIKPGRLTALALSLIGTGGIVLSGIWITEQSAFPGTIVLLPVLSTACLIAGGAAVANPINALLRLKPMRFIGDISFSLYLFHWPAIVFVGLYLARPLDEFEKLLLLAITTVLAAINWRMIETPFRNARTAASWRRAVLVIGGGVIVSIAVSIGILTGEGLPQRLPQSALAVHQHMLGLDLSQSACRNVARLTPPPKARLCSFSGERDQYDYLLWGDSHAGMMAPALSNALAAQGRHGLIANLPGCHALLDTITTRRKNRAACITLTRHMIEVIRTENIPIVIIADRWANLHSDMPSPGDGKPSETLLDASDRAALISLETALQRTLRAVRQAGAVPLIIGPTPEVNFHVPAAMIRAQMTGKPLPPNSRNMFDQRQALVLDLLGKLEASGTQVFYPHPLLCDAYRCETNDNALPYYRDDDHLTDHGMARLTPELVKMMLEMHPAR